MRILQVHNYYQQTGGEDAVVAAERAMLEEHGHEVVLFQRNNEEINGWSPLHKIFRVIWNRKACRELEALIDSFAPDVIHVHNVFHAISMSAYQAAKRKGVPLVQTLHNYRLFCLNGLFFRGAKKQQSAGGIEHGEDARGQSLKPKAQCLMPLSSGAICELCLKHKAFPWPGVRYRCYRDSLAGSFVVAVMLAVHRLLRTWVKPVSRFIVLTSFCRDKFIQCGIPPEKISLKPNFLSQDPGEGNPSRDPHFLFLGRLSEEKGVRTLVQAWEIFQQAWSMEHGAEHSSQTSDLGSLTSDNNHPQLLIAGTGPERDSLEKLSSVLCPPSSVNFLGHIDRLTSVRLLKSVRALIFPSGCYETFGLSVVEAMACGTPVLVGDANAAASLVRDGETGVLFRAGDPKDLAEKMAWTLKHLDECAAMGKAARQEYETFYTAEANYKILMDIYRQVIVECKQ